MKPYKDCILFLATALCSLASFSQSLPEKLKVQIQASALPGIQYPNEVRAFYQHNNYNYSWLDEQHRSDLRQLLVYTGNAALLGQRNIVSQQCRYNKLRRILDVIV